MKRFLSATEFARIVRRDPKTIIAWIHNNYIPGVKRVGHTYQIPTREIHVYQSVTRYPPKKWRT